MIESPSDGREGPHLLDRNGNMLAVILEVESTVRSPRDFPRNLEIQGAVQFVGDQEVVNLAAMECRGSFSTENVSLKLALNDHSSQLIGRILPVTTDDERSLERFQESKQVAQDLCVQKVTAKFHLFSSTAV